MEPSPTARRTILTRSARFAAFAALAGGAAAFFGVALASGCGQSPSQAGWSGAPANQIVTGQDGDVDAAIADAGSADTTGSRPPPTQYDGSVGTTVMSAAPPTCSGKSGGSGKIDMALVSGGMMRTAHMYVPSTYDPTKGTMLVVNFHGFTMEGAAEEAYTELDANAERHGYIVVYPDGINGSWNGGDCCGVAWTGGVDDVQFARDLVAHVNENWCLDPARIHTTGYSNGGFLSYELACRAADLFASMYSVAGVIGIPPAECAPGRPFAVMEMHGTADPVVHWAGGTPVSPWNFGGPITFQSVDTTIHTFRTLNNCLGVGDVVYANGDVSCTDYGSCAESADVVLCTITGGGHTWPDVGDPDAAATWIGPTSYDIDADEMGYEFLYAHPMPSL